MESGDSHLESAYICDSTPSHHPFGMKFNKIISNTQKMTSKGAYLIWFGYLRDFSIN